MQVELTSAAFKHLEFWRKSGDKAILRRISMLTDSIIESPFQGIGKPEALKYELSGKWSRRINNEHRYVYSLDANTITIFSLKGQYLKGH